VLHGLLGAVDLHQGGPARRSRVHGVIGSYKQPLRKRPALAAQLAAFLGPKTEADLAKPEKKKREPKVGARRTARQRKPSRDAHGAACSAYCSAQQHSELSGLGSGSRFIGNNMACLLNEYY